MKKSTLNFKICFCIENNCFIFYTFDFIYITDHKNRDARKAGKFKRSQRQPEGIVKRKFKFHVWMRYEGVSAGGQGVGWFAHRGTCLFSEK